MASSRSKAIIGRLSPSTTLEALPRFNHKTYQELPAEYQDRFDSYPLNIVTFLRGSDPELKFDIFERLNSGAVPLNDMELRKCIYRGRYMELLIELSEEEEFRALLDLRLADVRMKDIELVLRFAAFFHATYLNYISPIKTFLNEDMDKHRQISPEDERKLRDAFKRAVLNLRTLFPNTAFKRFNRGKTVENPYGSWEEKKFNASLYDVMMGVFCKYDRSQIQPVQEELREAIIELMATDEEFIDAIEKSTSSKLKVKKRFDKFRGIVEPIIERVTPQPRIFPFEIKQKLFQHDPTCGICHQPIYHIDDAHVDHITPFSLGGATTIENARIAHRYCNMARGNRDV